MHPFDLVCGQIGVILQMTVLATLLKEIYYIPAILLKFILKILKCPVNSKLLAFTIGDKTVTS